MCVATGLQEGVIIAELMLTSNNQMKVVSCVYTVEPPNKGQVGAWALVHYSGVVLYWGVFVKKPFLCVVSVYWTLVCRKVHCAFFALMP